MKSAEPLQMVTSQRVTDWSRPRRPGEQGQDAAALGELVVGHMAGQLADRFLLALGWAPRGRPPSPWLGRRPERLPGCEGLSSWQGGTAQGGGANPRPRHGHGSLPTN